MTNRIRISMDSENAPETIARMAAELEKQNVSFHIDEDHSKADYVIVITGH